MSGLNYRGRQRLRDHAATERLRTLLAAADADDEEITGAPDAQRPGAGSSAPVAGETECVAPGHPRPPWTDPEPAGAARAACEGADPEHQGASERLGAVAGTDRRRARDERDPTRGAQHRQPVRVRHTLATPAAVVLAVVLLVVCAFAALSLTRGEPAASPVLEVTAGPDPAAPPAGAAGSAPAAPAPVASGARGASTRPGGALAGADGTAAPAGTLTVHIAGEVRAPGVVEVSPGARVIDAVGAAGGLTEGAVTDRVNLAEPLADGQQVIIPDRETADAVAAGQGPGPAGGTPGGAPGDRGLAPAGPVPAAGPAGTVDLNTATAAELETLPRVGPVLAQRIVDFRTQHGPFTAPEQLDDVSGIGPALLEALLPLVTT